MKKMILSALLIYCCTVSCQKEYSINNNTGISELLGYFDETSSDSVLFSRLWTQLEQQNRIPFTTQDSALFLFRGKADSVSWSGDFNGWGSDIKYKNKGIRLKSSDLFYLATAFPEKTRLDYKIIVDGNWMLDPFNKKVQKSGFGPNSSVALSTYQPSNYLTLSEKVQSGEKSEPKIIQSKKLGYSVSYTIWTAAQFNPKTTSNFSVLYVTDGQEYQDPELGALPIVAANLLAENKITPLVIVFISPINPENSQENRRMKEYIFNPNYSRFLVDELISAVEKPLNIDIKRENRAILGTSLGGLESAYLMATESQTFGRIGIHSPAFWFRHEIFDLVKNMKTEPERLFMSTGTIHDTEKEADKMKSIFDEKGWNSTFLKVPEGHSWGNWSGLMDKTLLSLFGTR